MKKISTFICAGVLMSALCAAVTACDEPKDPENPEIPTEIGIVPVAESEAVSASFTEPLNSAISEFLRKEAELGEYTVPVCMTINSAEEFRTIVPFDIELPQIEFEKYTLVVARYHTTGGVGLEKVGVDAKSDPMKLNMVFTGSGKGITKISMHLYCGLYPKLPQKPVVCQPYYYIEE